jgi:hypothetical protein
MDIRMNDGMHFALAAHARVTSSWPRAIGVHALNGSPLPTGGLF